MVAARDRDSGSFGDISYRISGGNSENLFTIDSRTGLLTIARSLAATLGKSFIHHLAGEAASMTMASFFGEDKLFGEDALKGRPPLKGREDVFSLA
jgi:hypothetical protein